MSEAERQSAAAPYKRRWYQFSLRTLLLLPLVLALVLSAIYSWPYVHRRYVLWRLQDYVDRDLRKLPLNEILQVNRWIGKVAGDAPDKDPYLESIGYRTWFLHAADIPCVGRGTCVIQIQSCLVYPGTPSCRFLIVASSGALLCSKQFFIGNRADVTKVECSESPRGFLCLTVEVNEEMTGNRRYYYRVADPFVELLRSEHLDGLCAMGGGNPFWMRERPPDWSDWQMLLDSPDQLQQLRGLAAFWMSRDPQYPKSLDDNVRHRLTELAASPDPWISEEAKLALKEAVKE